MKRKDRKEYLEKLENLLEGSSKSISRVIYELEKRGQGKTVMKSLAKDLHPWDYKNQYPMAVELFTRVCYSKKRDTWGLKVARKGAIINDMMKYSLSAKWDNNGDFSNIFSSLLDLLGERPGELGKRFVGLLKKCGSSEELLQKLLILLEEHVKDPRELEKIKEKLVKSHETFYHDATIFTIDSLILLNKNKEAR